MKLTIFGTNCIDDLDPSATVAEQDAEQTVQNYRDAVEEKILQQYPEATVIWQTASPSRGEFAIRQLPEGENEENILDDLRRIAEVVFEKGEFYA